MKPPRTFGWQSFRRVGGRTIQTREIVLAASKAAAARAAGVNAPSKLFNLTETHNLVEVALALARPGTIFWAPMSTGYRAEDYTAAAPFTP